MFHLVFTSPSSSSLTHHSSFYTNTLVATSWHLHCGQAWRLPPEEKSVNKLSLSAEEIILTWLSMESNWPVMSLSSSPRITFTLSPRLGTTGARWSAAILTVLDKKIINQRSRSADNLTFLLRGGRPSTCLVSPLEPLQSAHTGRCPHGCPWLGPQCPDCTSPGFRECRVPCRPGGKGTG